jgi:hypothetical protein
MSDGVKPWDMINGSPRVPEEVIKEICNFKNKIQNK